MLVEEQKRKNEEYRKTLGGLILTPVSKKSKSIF
jgi:hypothetical protein